MASSIENRFSLTEFQDFEVECLTGKFHDFKIDADSLSADDLQNLGSCFELEKINTMLNLFSKQNYRDILQLKLSEIFRFNCSDPNSNSDPVKLLENLLQFAQSQNSDFCTYLAEIVILLIGVSSLSEFVRHNWTGPIDDTLRSEVMSDLFMDDSINIQSSLFFKDEDISCNVRELHLLYISHLCITAVSSCISQKWWLFRCLMLHQKILPDKDISLHNQMKSLVTEIFQIDCMSQKSNIALHLQLLIESAHMHLYYGEIALAKEHISNAQTLTGLEIEFSGAIGKRTQYQIKPVAQLYVKLKRNLSMVSQFSSNQDNGTFPCDVVLQDDTLLNKIAFVDDTANFIDDLLVEEQIVLLANCCLMRRSSAFDELLQEQMIAFIHCLLSQPKVWCIYVRCLIMRSKAEKDSSRKVERSMMQLQALVDAVKKDSLQFSTRQCMFYSCPIPTHWLVEKELADILLTLGATKSALEIYERLQLWEDIVHCYQRLDRKNKAEEIVRKQLEKMETPNLYCLLGDVTDDPANYFTAWELSNKRNARSQKSLGYYYFKRKEYEKSISFFMTSLEINHLQQDVWFSVGYAATQVENYELAARGYRKVVTLDPDNFESWNNLSNAYIKIGQKFKAWKSLQEALKCNYEEWRVWENFLLVSIDLGAFEDVIHAWHRLLDIKKKHDDSELLNILVKAIVNDIVDMNGHHASFLRKKALQLFGRITSISTTDAVVWELYSVLYSSDDTCVNEKEKLERVVIYQQKSIRCFMQKQHWEKEFSVCKQVLKSALRFGEVTKDYIKLLEDTQKSSQKVSFKLMVQGIINIAERNLVNHTISDSKELADSIQLLKTLLSEILEL